MEPIDDSNRTPRLDPESKQRLREEMLALVAEQVSDLERATFLGMTPVEKSQFDDRRAKIYRLMEQLEVFRPRS